MQSSLRLFGIGIGLLLAIFANGCGTVTKRGAESAHGMGTPSGEASIRTDAHSIDAGRIIFKQKCEYCHYPDRTEKLVGPGFRGILKNPTLPVSGRPATAENIVAQLRHPMTSMPSFVTLSPQDIGDLLAFLNTL